VARVNAAIVQFLQGAEVRQRILGFGLAPSGASTPESTAEFIRKDQER
jgi:tripartite-type tricarboxylate transporter receptor subunit TctC